MKTTMLVHQARCSKSGVSFAISFALPKSLLLSLMSLDVACSTPASASRRLLLSSLLARSSLIRFLWSKRKRINSPLSDMVTA